MRVQKLSTCMCIQVKNKRSSLLDRYQYVMYGKVFKIKEVEGTGVGRLEVYISCGGLLLLLTGDTMKLSELDLD